MQTDYSRLNEAKTRLETQQVQLRQIIAKAREENDVNTELEAQGETVIIQDFTAAGEPIEAVIEQVSFTRTTPPNGNFTGWGGILQITARTVV